MGITLCVFAIDPIENSVMVFSREIDKLKSMVEGTRVALGKFGSDFALIIDFVVEHVDEDNAIEISLGSHHAEIIEDIEKFGFTYDEKRTNQVCSSDEMKNGIITGWLVEQMNLSGHEYNGPDDHQDTRISMWPGKGGKLGN